MLSALTPSQALHSYILSTPTPSTGSVLICIYSRHKYGYCVNIVGSCYKGPTEKKTTFDSSGAVGMIVEMRLKDLAFFPYDMRNDVSAERKLLDLM
ncbi:unnamed protein product [Allacma fusca]|uniref:Uncharacterized protein n=1 Tax=Allacma fusca TaxID=39272 RepID=A0A8J2LIM4_9HEXA|nr:unnamed protein product [Allacma fusca]